MNWKAWAKFVTRCFSTNGCFVTRCFSTNGCFVTRCFSTNGCFVTRCFSTNGCFVRVLLYCWLTLKEANKWVRKVFWEILKNLEENTCDGKLFSRVAGLQPTTYPATLLKTGLHCRHFSVNFPKFHRKSVTTVNGCFW